MSLDRIKGNVAFICDGDDCLESLETDHGDFGIAKEQAQEEGWLFRKRDGSWRHYCSIDCERSEA